MASIEELQATEAEEVMEALDEVKKKAERDEKLKQDVDGTGGDVHKDLELVLEEATKKVEVGTWFSGVKDYLEGLKKSDEKVAKLLEKHEKTKDLSAVIERVVKPKFAEHDEKHNESQLKKARDIIESGTFQFPSLDKGISSMDEFQAALAKRKDGLGVILKDYQKHLPASSAFSALENRFTEFQEMRRRQQAEKAVAFLEKSAIPKREFGSKEELYAVLKQRNKSLQAIAEGNDLLQSPEVQAALQAKFEQFQAKNPLKQRGEVAEKIDTAAALQQAKELAPLSTFPETRWFSQSDDYVHGLQKQIPAFDKLITEHPELASDPSFRSHFESQFGRHDKLHTEYMIGKARNIVLAAELPSAEEELSSGQFLARLEQQPLLKNILEDYGHHLLDDGRVSSAVTSRFDAYSKQHLAWIREHKGDKAAEAFAEESEAAKQEDPLAKFAKGAEKKIAEAEEQPEKKADDDKKPDQENLNEDGEELKKLKDANYSDALKKFLNENKRNNPEAEDALARLFDEISTQGWDINEFSFESLKGRSSRTKKLYDDLERIMGWNTATQADKYAELFVNLQHSWEPYFAKTEIDEDDKEQQREALEKKIGDEAEVDKIIAGIEKDTGNSLGIAPQADTKQEEQPQFTSQEVSQEFRKKAGLPNGIEFTNAAENETAEILTDQEQAPEAEPESFSDLLSDTYTSPILDEGAVRSETGVPETGAKQDLPTTPDTAFVAADARLSPVARERFEQADATAIPEVSDTRDPMPDDVIADIESSIAVFLDEQAQLDAARKLPEAQTEPALPIEYREFEFETGFESSKTEVNLNETVMSEGQDELILIERVPGQAQDRLVTLPDQEEAAENNISIADGIGKMSADQLLTAEEAPEQSQVTGIQHEVEDLIRLVDAAETPKADSLRPASYVAPANEVQMGDGTVNSDLQSKNTLPEISGDVLAPNAVAAAPVPAVEQQADKDENPPTEADHLTDSHGKADQLNPTDTYDAQEGEAYLLQDEWDVASSEDGQAQGLEFARRESHFDDGKKKQDLASATAAAEKPLVFTSKQDKSLQTGESGMEKTVESSESDKESKEAAQAPNRTESKVAAEEQLQDGASEVKDLSAEVSEDEFIIEWGSRSEFANDNQMHEGTIFETNALETGVVNSDISMASTREAKLPPIDRKQKKDVVEAQTSESGNDAAETVQNVVPLRPAIKRETIDTNPDLVEEPQTIDAPAAAIRFETLVEGETKILIDDGEGSSPKTVALDSQIPQPAQSEIPEKQKIPAANENPDISDANEEQAKKMNRSEQKASELIQDEDQERQNAARNDAPAKNTETATTEQSLHADAVATADDGDSEDKLSADHSATFETAEVAAASASLPVEVQDKNKLKIEPDQPIADPIEINDKQEAMANQQDIAELPVNDREEQIPVLDDNGDKTAEITSKPDGTKRGEPKSESETSETFHSAVGKTTDGDVDVNNNETGASAELVETQPSQQESQKRQPDIANAQIEREKRAAQTMEKSVSSAQSIDTASEAVQEEASRVLQNEPDPKQIESIQDAKYQGEQAEGKEPKDASEAATVSAETETAAFQGNTREVSGGTGTIVDESQVATAAQQKEAEVTEDARPEDIPEAQTSAQQEENAVQKNEQSSKAIEEFVPLRTKPAAVQEQGDIIDEPQTDALPVKGEVIKSISESDQQMSDKNAQRETKQIDQIISSLEKPDVLNEANIVDIFKTMDGFGGGGEEIVVVVSPEKKDSVKVEISARVGEVEQQTNVTAISMERPAEAVPDILELVEVGAQQPRDDNVIVFSAVVEKPKIPLAEEAPSETEDKKVEKIFSESDKNTFETRRAA